jgi:hypothetical protein
MHKQCFPNRKLPGQQGVLQHHLQYRCRRYQQPEQNHQHLRLRQYHHQSHHQRRVHPLP